MTNISGILIRIRKLILSFAMATLIRAWYAFSAVFAKNWYDFNPVFMIIICIATPAVLLIVYQHIYSSSFEWVRYSPIYFAVCFFTSAPDNLLSTYWGNRIYETLNLALAMEFIIVFLSSSVLWAAFMLVFGLLVNAIRKLYVKSLTNLQQNNIELKKKELPVWLNWGFPVLDALLMMVPIHELTQAVIFLVGLCFSGQFNKQIQILALTIVVILWLVFEVFKVSYLLWRIISSTLLYRSYWQYLTRLPIYLISAVIMWLTFNGVAYKILEYNYAPLFWSIPETIRLQVGSHMSDELFYVILYYAQWFILISLALAVRGFIRYCNKMYVKEVMAAKEQA